ncbi:hypothetical protein JM84_0199 [Dokdonia sp. Hel_I_63]|uniref:hypothetical protein n=1 Tax=unclassified Dokdonia TaxID=2615033 RepID=UPI00020A62B2|nr:MULTISPECIES: hypothetical protein [unclassified Dokdonia]AEE19437.1 hypothetical protein Krodi_1454 [Dokdonia sp. 4H-3-7-5]TVZ21329.1 hypothetical protein JM84_0199 [Dokdonia sp. Hel_I_63]
MNKARRIFIIVLFFILAAMLAYGFYCKDNVDVALGHKFIGLSIAGGFFILMPTFIYHRWKDRKVADYMLTDDAFKRMKEFNNSKDKKR